MEESQGNPEIGMQADSFEAAEAANDSGSEQFFNDLDNQVNGGIVDTEATPIQEVAPEQVTHANKDEGSNNVAQSNNSTDWENDTLIVVERLLNGETDTKKLNNLYLFLMP